MKRFTLGLCALLVTICCGGVDAAPNETNASTSATTAEGASTASVSNATATEASSATNAAAETAANTAPKAPVRASLKGMVKFENEAPVRKPIDMSSEPNCHHDDALDETVIVNDGGLANVVISISKGLAKEDKTPGEGKVILSQKGCAYVPHVLAMQEGQILEIHNEDGVVHNVHSYSKRNASFNQAQPAGAPPIVKEMSRKDKMFPVKCDMHAWMSAQIVVFDHPYYTISGASGAFELGNLPPGEYTIIAEHETLGTQTADVKVGDSGVQELNFTFKS